MEFAKTVHDLVCPVKPWTLPMEEGAVVKYVFANTLMGYNTKVFRGNEAYEKYRLWSPDNEQLPFLYCMPLSYNPFPNRVISKLRHGKEPYIEIYKYRPGGKIFEEKELLCRIARSTNKIWLYNYILEFGDKKLFMHQHLFLPIIDFKIGDQRYRWTYFSGKMYGHYYYSLYKAEEKDYLLCDFIDENTGDVHPNKLLKESMGGNYDHDKYRLKHKIANFTYVRSVPLLGYQKTCKLHLIPQDEETDAVIVMTALVLKLHENYKWKGVPLYDYNTHSIMPQNGIRY